MVFTSKCGIQNMKKSLYIFIVYLTSALPKLVFGQAATDTVVTLKQCVSYALRNQPAVRQANIDEEINEKNIRIGLAD